MTFIKFHKLNGNEVWVNMDAVACFFPVTETHTEFVPVFDEDGFREGFRQEDTVKEYTCFRWYGGAEQDVDGSFFDIKEKFDDVVAILDNSMIWRTGI